jgi:hypothetical protein
MCTTTTPPPVPSRDGTVVLDDFGEFGQACRESDPTQADLQTVVANLITMRKVDGWQSLATKPIDQPIELAA